MTKYVSVQSYLDSNEEHALLFIDRSDVIDDQYEELQRRELWTGEFCGECFYEGRRTECSCG